MSGRPREPLEDLKWKKGHRQIGISGAGSRCVAVSQPGPSPQPGAVGSSGKRWPRPPGLGIRAIWLQGCHRVMVKCGQRTRSLRSHGCRAVPHFVFALSGFVGKAAATHLSARDIAPVAAAWLRADSADEDTGMAPRRSVLVEPRRRRGSVFQKAVGAAAEGPGSRRLRARRACSVLGGTRWPRPGPPVCSLVT